MFVFFDVTGLIALIGLIVLGGLDSSIRFVSGFLFYFLLMFLLKNFIEGVIWSSLIKRNQIIGSVINFFVDIARAFLFYQIVINSAEGYFNAGGLGTFGAMFSMVFVFIVGGGLYLTGDLFSSAYARRDREVADAGLITIGIGLFLIILFTFYKLCHVSQIYWPHF